jgi:integrase
MNEMTAEFLAQSRAVFKDMWPTLEAVRQKVRALESSTRRRDALSAFEALKTQFKVDPAATPATFPALRRIFATRNAAQLGVSPKRFANIRSEVFRTVKEFGVPSPTLTRAPELTIEWQELLAQVQVANYRSSLTRLGRYCSAVEIPPLEVGRKALLGLYEALMAEGGVKDPHVIIRHVTSYWNFHEKRLPRWPQVRLKTPFATNSYLLSLSDLPASLRKEIVRWQERRSGGDLLSLEKVAHKSRPETVNHQTAHILRYLGLAVRYGIATLRELTSLAEIVEPEMAQAVVTIIIKERKLSIGYAHSFTYVLLGIARHETTASPAKVQQLATLAANLRHQIKKGMSKKNRGTLRQFDNPEDVRRLMAFPDDERKRGHKLKNPHRQAKCYERALIADLFIHGALRIRNVVKLRMDLNMRRHGSAYILTFSGDEMKNGRDHAIQLPDWLTEHVEEYKAKFRPRLVGHEGPYLFPGKVADGHRHHSGVREEFSRYIYRHLGFKVHPHFMRHLTSKLILDEDPGLLRVVSNRLGHTTTETAQLTYLETDSLSASRKANQLLSSMAQRPKSPRK